MKIWKPREKGIFQALLSSQKATLSYRNPNSPEKE